MNIKPIYMLTGKCKEDFNKWNTQLSPQYGDYEDFFEENGMLLDMHPILDYDKDRYIRVAYFLIAVIVLKSDDEENFYEDEEYPTKKEAREAVLLKANEMYNLIN